MIGKIKGIVDAVYEDSVIVDVNGVGYKIFCSVKTLSQIQGLSGEVSLIIETIVREDYIHLYGFLSEIEKDWFNQLCKVNGVGNKVALKILSVLNVEEVINAIATEDKKSFCRVGGIGGRLATRIITELKSVVKKMGLDTNIKICKLSSDVDKGILNDAISALENLGYSRNVFYNVTVNILEDRNDITLESLITETLKKINNF